MGVLKLEGPQLVLRNIGWYLVGRSRLLPAGLALTQGQQHLAFLGATILSRDPALGRLTWEGSHAGPLMDGAKGRLQFGGRSAGWWVEWKRAEGRHANQRFYLGRLPQGTPRHIWRHFYWLPLGDERFVIQGQRPETLPSPLLWTGHPTQRGIRLKYQQKP